MRRATRHRGFSLLELMVTVLVAAIFLAIAVPSFRSAIQRHRMTSAIDDLQSAIQYARTEAVLRASYVSLCSSADGATCAATNTYETGWLVYSHPVATTTASATYTSAAASAMQILRSAPAFKEVSARSTDTLVVTFGQQGQLEKVSSRTSATTPVTFVLCTIPGGKTGLGTNTTAYPGSRIGVSPFGGIQVAKLGTSDACTP